MDPLRLGSSPRKHILIVEDDAALRTLYAHALTAAGYRVIAVEDGLDALRRIDSGLVPDAVLLDLNLPRLDGFDVERELRVRPETRNLPIVVVTARDDAWHLQHHHFNRVLRKPVDPDVIVVSVARCLGETSV